MLGHCNGQRFSDVADAVACQYWLGCLAQSLHPEQIDQIGCVQVCARNDRNHSRHSLRLLDVEALHPSMRERRAHEHGVQQPRLTQVGHELTLPGEQGRILHPSDRSPNPAVHGGKGVWPEPPSGPPVI